MKEQPANIEAVPVAPRTSEQLLVGDVVAGIPIHSEETLSKLVLQTLISGKKGRENHVSKALETVMLHTVQMVVSSPEFVCKFLNIVINNPGFVNTVAVLVRSEKRKLAVEQDEVEN